ncbi:MAG TPA: DUF1592 domain-containing protein [Kofleriaceae bacterium]|nr:DUF1592 domain-containing protein [Kofleriaceae bacterium]
MQRRILFAILLASGAVAGCGNDTKAELPSAADRFPRLSHAQWEATVKDLFRMPAESGLSSTFTPDPQLGRFDNNIARLGLSQGLWRDYQQAAEVVASKVVTDEAIYARLVPAQDARAFVTELGMRAFRRPLKPAEVERYLALFDSAAPVFPQHDAFKAGVRLVVQGMLQSPFFLYRSEISNTRAPIGLPLSGYEVASRMSYLFWNTMPDDELFAAAKAGELDDADGVRRQASRLFDDPRTQAQFRRFHYQAFSISDYADIDKSTTVFPTWRRDMGSMMQEEALRFLESVVSNDGTVADLLTSTKAFVNKDLAKIYGIAGDFGDDFVEVNLDPATRAGLLTRAGFLARNATLVEADPIHRGVSINIGILCRQISAPPVIPDNLVRSGETNREKVDSVTGQGTCGENCHYTIINPLGFAFENFDAIGAYRTMDSGKPVNSAATYHFADGRAISYGNAVELSKQLAVSPEVHQCYARQLLEFMLGRDLHLLDSGTVRSMAQSSLEEQASIKEMVMSIVESNAFRVRSTGERSQP